MTRKTNIILFFLLLVQILIIGYVYRPGREAGPPMVKFFEGLTLEQINSLTIVDDEAKSIALEKTGQNWVIASENDLPADQDKAESLLTKLIALQSSRAVTQTKSSHERLKVGKNFVRKITFGGEDGKMHTLLLGSAPSYKTAHVRAGDENPVYLVKDLSAWEIMTNPSSWWQSQYLAVDPNELVGLALTNGHGQVTLKKEGDKGQWRLADAEDAASVDQNKVLDFIEGVSRITLSEYLGQEAQPEYGLDKAVAEVTLTTKNEAIHLMVGAHDEEGNSFVLKSSLSPFYVKAGKYAVTLLLEQKQGALLTAESNTDQPNSQ